MTSNYTYTSDGKRRVHRRAQPESGPQPIWERKGRFNYAAQVYLDAGWTGILHLPPGKKSPPPGGCTGQHPDPSPEQIEEWQEEHPDGNVGLRLPEDVLGLDVDHYDGKTGGDTLRALECVWGALPATWISTSRAGSVSGIRFVKVPTGLKWPNEVGPGIDTIRHGHRYAVVFPSTHPEDRQYRWIPSDRKREYGPGPDIDDLPLLPDKWIEGLTVWSKVVRDKVIETVLAFDNGSSRHDTAMAGCMALVRFKERNLSGAAEALEDLRAYFINLVTPDRERGEAEAEWERMVDGAWKKVEAEPSSSQRETGSTVSEDQLFRLWTPGQLLDEPRVFEWLVKGLWTQPSYGQIAGEMKTLKSTLAAFMVVGVAAGKSIFSHFEILKPRPVLMYVGEGGRIPFTERLERVAKAMSVDLRDLPLHFSFDVAPISSDVFQQSLERDLSEIEPGLVVIDPLYAFHGLDTSASNLHQEGSLLSSISAPCTEAGASLIIVNHFNQTGSGDGLKRITQAGSGEWVDSWVLLSHREKADVENGLFQLKLDIGNRRWGGTTWDLDLDLGSFDVDLGQHVGEIKWKLSSHHGQSSSPDEDRILAVLARSPWTYGKEELTREVGGTLIRVRDEISRLVSEGEISTRKVDRKGSDGRKIQALVYGLASSVGDDGK